MERVRKTRISDFPSSILSSVAIRVQHFSMEYFDCGFPCPFCSLWYIMNPQSGRQITISDFFVYFAFCKMGRVNDRGGKIRHQISPRRFAFCCFVENNQCTYNIWYSDCGIEVPASTGVHRSTAYYQWPSRWVWLNTEKNTRCQPSA